jgi:hypothetical protein
LNTIASAVRCVVSLLVLVIAAMALADRMPFPGPAISPTVARGRSLGNNTLTAAFDAAGAPQRYALTPALVATSGLVHASAAEPATLKVQPFQVFSIRGEGRVRS